MAAAVASGCRLRLCTVHGPWAYVFTDDETLARPREIGILTHQAIARLAARTLSPTSQDIQRASKIAVARFGQIETRAHQQTVAGGLIAYFRHLLPPSDWAFSGSEHHLGAGRVDLVWTSRSHRIMADEVKTGHWPLRAASRTQTLQYLEAGLAAWGECFAGVRLLSTGDPRRSLVCLPHGQFVPLTSTQLIRSR